MSKQPPPAPTASAIGPCPTIIQTIVGRPGTESLLSTFAPPVHPQTSVKPSILCLNKMKQTISLADAMSLCNSQEGTVLTFG